MRTRIGSRIRAEAVWTLALLLGVPALGHAQQTGLFPLRPIKRQRVPCPAEDPIYRQYREMYFGYFPTCWHRFPAGWGCPSPEAPNKDAEYNRLRPKPPEQLENGLDGDGGGAMNEEDVAPRRGGAEPRPSETPLPPIPRGGRDPFDFDATKPGNNPPALPPPNANRSAPGAAVAEAGLAPREADSGEGPADALMPLPAAPPAEAPPASNGNPLPAVEAPASASNDSETAPTAQPAQAPQRRSLLGALFGGLRRR